MRLNPLFIACLFLLLGIGAMPLRVCAETQNFFEESIAPLIQTRCLECHDGSGDSDLVLSSGEDLYRLGLIEPGNYEGSKLREYLSGENESGIRMPPEGQGLSPAEISLFRDWIDGGADWPKGYQVSLKGRADKTWWSLQPIRNVEESSLDSLIDNRLHEAGLSRSPRADRVTLIRRLYQDLLGLPPPPEKVAEFLSDSDPKSWRTLVDEVLDSPRYGERYATHWLDLAHYADTHGFERDKRRPHAWRYRDYVIESFNEDKSYDVFLREQIAGDVLWPEKHAAVVATGFLAAGPWDFVGQVETKSSELKRATRVLDLDDMVTQVMTSTVGMTVHCARCHDHKLDPISQEEYYQLQAVFAGVTRGDRLISQEALEVYESEKKRLRKLRAESLHELGRLEGRGLSLADLVGGGDGYGGGDYRSGLDPRSAKIQTRDFGALGNVIVNQFKGSDYSFVDGVFIPDGSDQSTEINVSSTGLQWRGAPKTSGKVWDVIRNGPVASQHSPTLDGIDFTSESHDLLGLHANAGITFDLEPMRDVVGSQRLRLTTEVGYFGAAGDYHADVWILLDGKTVVEFRHLSRHQGLKHVDLEVPTSNRFLTLIATDGGNGYSHDQIGFGDARISAVDSPTPSNAIAQSVDRLNEEILRLDESLQQLGPPPKVFATIGKADPDVIRKLRRGEADSPTGDPISPGALQCIESLGSQFGLAGMAEGDRRVALANWLVDPRNPLTSRVMANRLWLWHFGRGIVSTPSDFGSGGALPTHPLLLDWLAGKLREHGGSLKAVHRLILNSETYCQTSRVSPDALGFQNDVDNDLLWKQNARRLTAEAIRDSILAVSGKLNLSVGGPGFEDFEYTDAYAPIYQYIVPDDPTLWRRSIYRYVVRTTPNAFLTTLDCPDPAVLTPKRLTTTTPLQSLALFNNEFLIRQSQYFADRLNAQTPEVSQQVRRAFLLAYSREPRLEEQSSSTEFILENGLFAFCRVLFNSNEFLYVD